MPVSKPRGPRSPVRRLLAGVLVVVVVWAGIEAGSWLLYLVLQGRFFSFSDVWHDQEVIAHDTVQSAAPDPAEVRAEALFQTDTLVLHPYVGFTHGPPGDSVFDFPINELGFLGESPMGPASEGEIRIGLFGGSVAFGVWGWGRDALVAELASTPALADRRVRVFCFAVGGYKQPQQASALVWLGSQGVELDAVVNLDGFNEVVLPPVEVLPDAPAAYPRAWTSYTSRSLDPPRARLIAQLFVLRERRRALAGGMGRAPVRLTVSGSILWRVLDRRLSRAIAELEQETTLRDQGRAPTDAYASEEVMYRELAAVWARSSLQMHGIAKSLGAVYLHFLQPNQYVEGSRDLTPRELAVAFQADHPYRDAARQGYPHLRAAGDRLRTQGVGFHDLTSMFRDDPREIYNDTCCHFTADGYQAIGAEMGRQLAIALTAQEAARSAATQ